MARRSAMVVLVLLARHNAMVDPVFLALLLGVVVLL